ncbi:MAG: cobalamin-dependent protein, partial [Endomicrobiales bacterium]
MLDVLLFRPYVPGVLTDKCSLGLVYVATSLANQGVTVKIIDEVVTPNWQAEVDKALDSSIVCAGVSVMTGRSIKSALEFSKRIKEKLGVPVVWGGIHPSFLPEQTLKNEYVEIVVIGEGERSFCEIVKSLKNKQSVSHIKGIGLKENSKIHLTGKDTNYFDLNTLPVPDFGLIDTE